MARPSVTKNPPQSVKVVAKMVADCAGSKPRRFITNGIATPVRQALMWLKISAARLSICYEHARDG